MALKNGSACSRDECRESFDGSRTHAMHAVSHYLPTVRMTPRTMPMMLNDISGVTMIGS